MDITPFIAAYGAIVATAGAAIQYNNYKNSKAGLLIKSDVKSNSYFFNPKEFGMDTYQSDYAAVISLKISNTSALPITIDDIYVHNKTLKKCYHHPFGINHLKNFKENSTDRQPRYVEYPPSKRIELPLRINPYDTIYGSVRIPFARDAVVDNKIDQLVITVETPRQYYSYTVSLVEYDTLHEICSRPKKN